MFQRKQIQENAVLRTLANKNAQNFATKRILRDLKEIEENKIPTVGVTARPLENDLFIWHGNLKAPKGSMYAGGVFHIEISLPENYPHSPPQIKLFNPIIHPNVFQDRLCLDMLDKNQNAWSSGYSIQSILIQLQTFLLDNYDEQNLILKSQKKQIIQEANSFQCTQKFCKHKGKLSAWPQFNQQEENQSQFQNQLTENQIFENELVCYHTKLNYKQSPLGIGINIKRINLTGEISFTSTVLDYISLRAYMNEKVHKNSQNQVFQNWIPLYLGYQKEKSIEGIEKGISNIITQSSKRFEKKYILQLIPKILISIIADIITDKKFCSTQLIRQFTQMHSLLLVFLQKYPDLQDQIEEHLSNFINKPEYRTKDFTKNLGEILIYTLVSNKFSFKDIQQLYFDESLDRQVFWILQKIPELCDKSLFNQIEEDRPYITYQCQSASYQIFAFLYKIISFFKNKDQSLEYNEEILKNYEQNFSKVASKDEDYIQKQCFQILQINNFQGFFEFMNMKVPDSNEFNQILIQAIQNSKDKNYHGSDRFALPDSNLQIEEYNKEQKKIFLESFFDQESLLIHEKEIQQHSNDKNKIRELEQNFKASFSLQFTEQDWKDACLKRWQWILQLNLDQPNLTPTQVLQTYQEQIVEDKYYLKDELWMAGEKYMSSKDDSKDNQYSFGTTSVIDQIEQQLTWQQLFIRFDLEEHLQDMNERPDFKNFYHKLSASVDHVFSLNVRVPQVEKLYSGYYYITALLSHLTKLKNIQFISYEYSLTQNVSIPFMKAVNKGFVNFNKNGGKLQRIAYLNFDRVLNNQQATNFPEQLFKTIQELQNLQSLNIKNNNFLESGCGKYLANFISNQKCLTELDISNSKINLNDAKLVADGIMRAKQLKYINLSRNQYIKSEGLAAIIYNLAFQPNIESINISNCSIQYENNERLSEALSKLLSITTSLEYLNLSNLSELNLKISMEFFQSLGQNKTLKFLNLSNSGIFSRTGLKYLGNAIAFNSQKKGSLKYLLIKKCINRVEDIGELYKQMNISDYDNENWYGDSAKINNMKGENFKKVYYNQLRILDFSDQQLQSSQFNLNQFQKQFNPQVPDYLKFVQSSDQLQMLNLSKAELKKSDIDWLSLSLDPTKENFSSNIKILILKDNLIEKEAFQQISHLIANNPNLEYIDLSKNLAGVYGAQKIASSLMTNKTLKYLNLYANKLEIEGARFIGKALKYQKSLEFLDIGYNSIKDVGMKSVILGVLSNEESQLVHLGLRYNLLTYEGIIDILSLLKEGSMTQSLEKFVKDQYIDLALILKNLKSTKLKNVSLKNNYINQYNLNILQNKYSDKASNFKVDLFNKLESQTQSKLERSIWMRINSTDKRVILEFVYKNEVGIIKDIRFKKGTVWKDNFKNINKFCFVEFASKISVARAMRIQNPIIKGEKVKIYQAGTNQFQYKKKSRAKGKDQRSKTNVLIRQRKLITKFKKKIKR